ncbi:hypothetical protein EZV62_004134 [Acer yangbiense]|uniref:AB hydrolase-1 domain-containing protein n=1 Tax=Acer yangbiense TaxID=1000413 RepID=A0A5C7IJE6_9ROSI|nr:hypothetical protein EZV62_004134 [Acer yangbiense]
MNQNPIETRQSDNVVHDSYEAVDRDAPHTVPHVDCELEQPLDDRFDIGDGLEQHHISGRCTTRRSRGAAVKVLAVAGAVEDLTVVVGAVEDLGAGAGAVELLGCLQISPSMVGLQLLLFYFSWWGFNFVFPTLESTGVFLQAIAQPIVMSASGRPPHSLAAILASSGISGCQENGFCINFKLLVLSCKNVFSSFQKVPRSPTPVGKAPKSDSEMRQKPLGAAQDEGELPVRLLADIDSLFVTLQGLTVHYKLCLPGSPPRSLSSTAFLEPNSTCSTPPMALGRLKVDRQALSLILKTQYQHLHRSYSNQFHSSSLYAPLLDGSAISAVISEDIPVLSLDDSVENDEMNSGNVEQDVEANGQFGIVLVHGFGGGVFSWRHVMGVLARQIGCTAAAFDRPSWGLTSRSRQKDWEEKELHNPYKLEAQVDLLLAFCSEMGFSSVVLVGHDDGGLLALQAAQ